MDRKYIEENEIEIKYLRNQLSDKELESFEGYLMENPEVLELLELDQVFSDNLHSKEALETVAGLSKGESFAEAKEGKPKTLLIQRFLDWIRIPIPAYASLLFTVGIASLVAIQPRTESVELLRFSTTATRGTQLQSEIDLSQVNGRAAVMIKLQEAKYQYYVLDVSSLDNKHIWQSDAFKVSTLKDKLILLPTTLNEQAIKIQVSGLEKDSSKTAVKFCRYNEVCN